MAWLSPTPASSIWERSVLTNVRSRHALERTLDIVIASVTLIVLLPILLIVAVAIRLDSRGPILYRQWRVGLDRRRPRVAYAGAERRREPGFGQPFRIYKFRSMVVDAEKSTGPVWAAKRDPRTTRVGTFLRRTHLDEFPQFINVLLGNMTLVGPRPERPELVRDLVGDIPDYAVRSRVLPGITGLAQIENGYDDSLDSARRKVALDISYIRRRNLAFDGQILCATAWIFVQGRQSARPEDREAAPEVHASADIVAARLRAISATYSSSNPDLPAIPILELDASDHGATWSGAPRHVHARTPNGHPHAHREAGKASAEPR